jgi:hypothetical protein
VASQEAGNNVYLGHYHVSSVWWSLFALASADETNSVNVNMSTLANSGNLAGLSSELINLKGNIAEDVRSLFGIPWFPLP